MAADIEKLFTATAKSSWGFLIEPGQGCYIPAYQRPYSWDRDNIARLNEDTLHGIRQLSGRPNTISFIGTIIAIHDTKYKTVDPIYRAEMAGRVMTIIDGQQRICTLVMSNMAIHDFIRRQAVRFSGKKEPQFFWLFDQATLLMESLRNTYLIDRATGDGNFRYYPRIIRAYFDAWSRRSGQARYQSPIAKIITGYIEHVERKDTKEYVFQPVDEKKRIVERYAAVADAFQYIKSELKRICQTDERDFPDLVSVTQSPDFATALWGYPFPDEVKKYVAEQASDANYATFCALLRAVILGKYLNERVAITIVTTDNEDDAFDMFEALNTTGEPLTAFETFKPKIIDAETLEKYESSPSRKSVDVIEGYLDRFKKADDKQRATSEMLIPFALAETGTKLQKKLNDQRRYLRDEFSSFKGDLAKTRKFVAGLAAVASFMRYGWDAEKATAPSFSPLEVESEEAKVSFEALRGLKHSITVAPISRFYEQALEAPDLATRTAATGEFADSIKATTAFSALWRAAKGGTENIDNHYRAIMREGCKVGADAIPPMAKRVDDKLGALSLLNYRRALRGILETQGFISSREEWIKMVVRTPIYKHSTTLARFLIFCAADDTMPDPAKNGCLIKGRPDISPMLNMKRWQNDYFTVEHIAPQAANAGWADDIYEDPDTVHVLGNLTLLPPSENAMIADRPWGHKRIMYGMLSSETVEDLEKLKAEAKKEGFNLSKAAEEVVTNAHYLALCKSVAAVEGPWNKALIDKRSECIASLAWDRLAVWL